MLKEQLSSGGMKLQVTVADWRGAIREAGGILVERGRVRAGYVDAMIAAVEDLGPYMVIMPGVALAHARPDDNVLSVGFSLVTLKEPVSFGSSGKDPVGLVVAFCATDSTAHVEALQQIAQVLGRPGAVESLMKAATSEDVLCWF